MDEFQGPRERETGQGQTTWPSACLSSRFTTRRELLSNGLWAGPMPATVTIVFSAAKFSDSESRPSTTRSPIIQAEAVTPVLRANPVRFACFDLHPAFLLTTCLVRAPLQTPNTFPLGAFYLKLPHSSVTFTGLKPILPRLARELWHDI